MESRDSASHTLGTLVWVVQPADVDAVDALHVSAGAEAEVMVAIGTVSPWSRKGLQQARRCSSRCREGRGERSRSRLGKRVLVMVVCSQEALFST